MIGVLSQMANHDDFTKTQLEKIGQRIKAIRIAQGYTSYEQFAHDQGISRMQYWRYEKGEDLRMSSLLKVLKGLNISIKDFFTEGFE